MDSVVEHAPIKRSEDEWYCKCGEFLCGRVEHWHEVRDHYFEHLETV